MKSMSPSLLKSVAVKGAVAAAAIAACSAASAVAPVTFTPTGQMFDTLQVLDYAKVSAVGSTFTEKGLLDVTTFVLAGSTFKPAGTNLYVSFDASGSSGVLTSLNYDVYSYSGPAATFSASSAGATKSATVDTHIATGMLIPGPTNNYGATLPSFAFLAANTLAFTDLTGAFSPVSGAVASFINTFNQLGGTSSSGFYVNAGGGTINLIPSAVPEPETYALMLGGLAAVGFVARRRSNV